MKNELLNHFYRLVTKDQDIITILQIYSDHASNGTIPISYININNTNINSNKIGESNFWTFSFGGSIGKFSQQVFTTDFYMFSETEMLEMSLLAKDPIILEKVKNLEAYV